MDGLLGEWDDYYYSDYGSFPHSLRLAPVTSVFSRVLPSNPPLQSLSLGIPANRRAAGVQHHAETAGLKPRSIGGWLHQTNGWRVDRRGFASQPEAAFFATKIREKPEGFETLKRQDSCG